MSKILLVEDDQDLSDMISGWLKSERYTVEAAYDGDLAREILKISSFDVVVLDWDLPSCSGIEILREFRENGGSTPVIMLTGKSTITDKETGLDIGADDYLTKPFLMDEVVLRLRAMLRRTAGAASAVLRVGQLEYDVVHGRFNLQGQGLQLTAQEHKILAFFMHHPGKLLTRSEISENVYARDLDADSNTLDVLIGRIRRKLGGAAQLVTERGQGFRLLASDEAAG